MVVSGRCVIAPKLWRNVSIVEDIRRLEEDFMRAVAERDLATLERLVGPEFTLTTGRPGSAVRGRDEWMRITATRYVIEDFGFDEMDVVDLGSAAVVRCRYHQRARMDDHDRTQPFLMTDVWSHRSSGWQLVSRHITPLSGGESPMRVPAQFDHAVIAVSDWERSNAFYRDVIGAELVERGPGFAYRLPNGQLDVHGPGAEAAPLAQRPVAPGGSDLCFEWRGLIGEAVEHLEHHGVDVEDGPVGRSGLKGAGSSVSFRDPDGSLLEFISYSD